jgi:hypothetical protein
LNDDKAAMDDKATWRDVHVEVLSHVARGARSRLQRLAEEDILGQLVPIWKQPGWTTPAEFLLTFSTLKDIRIRVDEIGIAVERLAIATETVLSGDFPRELPVLGPHPEPWRGEHDLSLLNELVDTARTSLSQLVERDRLGELIPWWKQPGITTPAEFFFLTRHTLNLATNVDSVGHQIEGLAQGVSIVGVGG